MAKEDEELGQGQGDGAEGQGEPLPEASDPPGTISRADIDDTDVDGPEDKVQDRKSRRAERRELKDTLSSTRNELAEVKRALEELRARPEPRPYVPQPPAKEEGKSPLDDELSGVEANQQAINAAISNPKISDAEAQAFVKEYNRLERRKQVLIARSVYQEVAANPSVTPESIATMQLQSEFPEIYADPVLIEHAKAEFAYLVHRMRKPETPATAREALSRLRDRIKVKPSAPTAAQQSRYGSVPRSAGGQGGRGDSYTPTKDVLNTARAYTAHLPDMNDQQRVLKWVQDVGKPAGLVR